MEFWSKKKDSFIKVYQILKKINKICKINKVSFTKNNFKETFILKLNSEKSKKYLKWKQKWDIDKTIQKILEWNANFNNKKMLEKLVKIKLRII